MVTSQKIHVFFLHFSRPNMPKLVNLKVAELRKRGYRDVAQWIADPQHLYIGRQMRIFIHTKKSSTEVPGTKVALDAKGNKILVRPSGNGDEEKEKAPDPALLKYPVGSYVDKRSKIIHLFIIKKSKWYNPFKVTRKVDSRGKVVEQYETYLRENKELMNELEALKEYTEIGCWCTPNACHGDVLLKVYKETVGPGCDETSAKLNERKRKTSDVLNAKPKKKRKLDDYFHS